jgi:transcriptional regulator with XRE-family HTH domain
VISERGFVVMTASEQPGLSIADRVSWHRRRRGLSRRALAELMGRSEEWLRLLETEGRGAQRLGTLVELARILRLSDLGSLIGQQVTIGDSNPPQHLLTKNVRRALNSSLIESGTDGRVALPNLRQRTERAWVAWHASRAQYTALRWRRATPRLLLVEVATFARNRFHQLTVEPSTTWT